MKVLVVLVVVGMIVVLVVVVDMLLVKMVVVVLSGRRKYAILGRIRHNRKKEHTQEKLGACEGLLYVAIQSPA